MDRKFLGFPENDVVGTIVKNKLARINNVVNKLEAENEKEANFNHVSAPATAKSMPALTPRPRIQRFLKQKETAPSSSTARQVKDLKESCGSATKVNTISVKPQQMLELESKCYFTPPTDTVKFLSPIKLHVLKVPASPPLKKEKHVETVSNSDKVIRNETRDLKTTSGFVKVQSPVRMAQKVELAGDGDALPQRRQNKFLKTTPPKLGLELKSDVCHTKSSPVQSDVKPASNVTSGTVSSAFVEENHSENPSFRIVIEPDNGVSSDTAITHSTDKETTDTPTHTNPCDPSLNDNKRSANSANQKDNVDTLVEVKVEDQKMSSSIPMRNSKPDASAYKQSLTKHVKILPPNEDCNGNKSVNSNESKTKSPKSSPVKRTNSSHGELDDVANQTSRPKRTIVPNKRFFSCDSPPPLQKSESIEDSRPLSKSSLPNPSSRKSVANEVSNSRKRSSSGDIKAKRKQSVENGERASVVPSIVTTVNVPNSSEPSRPRRTIIPNRKFMDEDILVPKELSPKKLDALEPKKKRRKSEKNFDLADACAIKKELSEPNFVASSQTNGFSYSTSTMNDHYGANAISIVQPENEVKIDQGQDKSGFITTSPIPPPVTNAKPASQQLIPSNDDELPLDPTRISLYENKPIYLGTCIVEMNGSVPTKDSIGEAVTSAIISCGICCRVKKYRRINEKRKRGAFLCSDCCVITTKIFSTALKAKPFSCIMGPPICEGQCPLVFNPVDQFCEACFAKKCLTNMPMKDDIYFKIWRSIPPICRGTMSTIPSINPTTPFVGKVVCINEKGDITSTTGSLKMFASKKNSSSNGVSSISEDSNSNDNSEDGDLNSARITTFAQRTDSSTNCENTIPSKSTDESLQDNLKDAKTNGVSNEEMLLDRQIGQERAKALVEPLAKPDLEDIEIFGFPVVVSGPAYPRKPLCFLCGSAGIEQLIYCSMCCEPFHPYCAGDDLLLNTYIARYNYQEKLKNNSSSETSSESPQNESNDILELVCTDEVIKIPDPASTLKNLDSSKIVLRWTCRRCILCKGCNESIGRSELIRCSRCQNPFHMKKCIDQKVFAKIKDVDTLKKVFTCDACLKCKSCGKKMESSRRLQTIQAMEEEDSDDEDKSDSNQIMMCVACFKQRAKGSFCPICEVCYDDNDWDSKMMECCKCNRWIHAACENLNNEQYHILGVLPPYIEYICKLCAPSECSLWYNAIQTQLIKDCNSALRLFEKKALGCPRKKRASIDVKPSYVCNLFGSSKELEVDEVEVKTENEKAIKIDADKKLNTISRLRQSIRKTVSSKEMLGCEVVLRDFVLNPKNLEENLYALKIMGVEILNEKPEPVDMTEYKEPTTPIFETPVKYVPTPTKHVSSICDNLSNSVNSITSIHVFVTLINEAIYSTTNGEAEMEILSKYVDETMKEVFPWFDPNTSAAPCIHPSRLESENSEDSCDSLSNLLCTNTDNPFKEMFWNEMDFFDDRMCALCGEVGDFPPETCGRLLYAGVNEWIHCNCAIWSSEVYELDDGSLERVGAALVRGRTLRCAVCNVKGATVSCCHGSCRKSYHLLCAMEAKCHLLENKKTYCPHHPIRDQECVQYDMKVARKVFVNLDWLFKKTSRVSLQNLRIFIGSLKVNSLGSLVPISVENLEWKENSRTLLVPINFQACRMFWTLDDPLRKESYTFKTSISSCGFENRTHDSGVNFVVDHSRSEENIEKGFGNISKFQRWISQAPKYVDEHLIDWLSPCREEFVVEEDFDLFGARPVDRSSPSSISSFGSGRKFQFVGQGYEGYKKKHGEDGCESDSKETVSTEGYSSSMDCYSNTPTSSRPISAQQKRRRSTNKGKRSPKKRLKQSEKQTFSPRRRSMRNLHAKDSVNYQQFYTCRPTRSVEQDSDNDSGVVEGQSTTDDEKPSFRINLLNSFNETVVEHLTKQEEQNLELFVDDAASESSCVLNPISSTLDEESMLQSTSVITTQKEEIYKAKIQYEIKRNNLSCFHSNDPKLTWMYLFETISKCRLQHKLKPLVHPTLNATLCDEFVERANSLRMLGLSHRCVQNIIEQLPENLEVMKTHSFYYRRRPYVDVNSESCPVSLNNKGCARAQGFQGRKPFDMFGWLASRHRKDTSKINSTEESSRGLGLPLAMRFRDLRTKAKRRFVVLYSEIHGRGLFARCDVDKGEMIIEYAGEVIRPSLSDPREKYYESRGIGCYMFRIKTQVIDATLKGNAARFINHSCDPNCEAKTVRILGKDHIIIFALTNIRQGEELTYDYKFEREDDKIPCTCGAIRCRKYLN